MLFKKNFRCASPSRQLNIINTLSIGADAQVQTEFIFQKVSVLLKELRDQLLDVAWVRLATIPFFKDALKQTIGVVKLATLEFNHPLRVRAHQEPNYVSRTTVVSAVQIPVLLRKFKVPVFKVFKSLFVHCADGETQVPKHFGVLQIQNFSLELFYDPGKHRILGQILR